jgi:hypothetical protein
MESQILQNFFRNVVLPTLGTDRPALIVYDGHSTHIDEEIILRALEENIIILKLPPHTSHLLQPLDLAVFKVFKTKWNEKLIAWQREHIGRKLPKSLFSKMLGETWKDISPDSIKNGFRKAGIHPFNSKIVSEEQFVPEALKRASTSIGHTHNQQCSSNEQDQPSTSTKNRATRSCKGFNRNTHFIGYYPKDFNSSSKASQDMRRSRSDLQP